MYLVKNGVTGNLRKPVFPLYAVFCIYEPLQKPKRRYRRFFPKRCKIVPISNNYSADNVIILNGTVYTFGRLFFMEVYFVKHKIYAKKIISLKSIYCVVNSKSFYILCVRIVHITRLPPPETPFFNI